ncbi:DEAD-box ATP-dependent RNA helicase 22 isoform X2 [Abrus precatorius]|uniref:RNA helicase n=1 Tax=Abrus precatorius TaxID=3816 RepID=A0A8B8KWF6_ABRPR|nr:DEAD-box ATP-dependent RNA helicase 22 isoform X2 [Abrus precatorius]
MVMIVTRFALMLHLQNPPIRLHLFSHFNNARTLFLTPTSPSLFKTRPFPRQTQSRAFVSALASSSQDSNGRDTFFAEETVSWSSLGLSNAISGALSNVGLNRPSLVQASSIPSVLSGKDVIIAAETGSGKTYSYLVPLIDKLRESHDHSLYAVSDQEVSPPQKVLLVLCPNVQLCEQVVRMASSLCKDNGETIVSVAAICGRQGWPIREPDIIVTTPAALLNYVDLERTRRMEFMRGVKYVVFDEADMLLCGSFQNKVIRLINLLRFDEKFLSRSKESVEELPMKQGSSLSSEDAFEATLPVNGKKTAGGTLKHMFPDAKWVCGNYLHCHNPRLEQKWIEVTVDTQVDELIKAVNHSFRSEDLDNAGGIHRTMVFANTVEAVEAVAKILLRSGIECLRYHKNCTLEERAQTLVDFHEKGGVLVCTDAAARGVDIPNVLHVIQADFATSAVDFLHRVGRTARAGQIGLVTSMYTESNRELVDAVRRAGELGQPVETAFSRKRSFRNKLKKRGTNKVRDSATIKKSFVA